MERLRKEREANRVNAFGLVSPLGADEQGDTLDDTGDFWDEGKEEKRRFVSGQCLFKQYGHTRSCQ